MTMCTFDHMLAVTCRSLCEIPFLEQLEWVVKQQPSAILLREKDLSEAEYTLLAAQVLKVCKKYRVPCILHTWIHTALRLDCGNIHLSFQEFKSQAKALQSFARIGVSIHSVEEAVEAERLGASYVTAGHIFPTDCKKGVPARGLVFLREVCQALQIPVYGIGGITKENAPLVLAQGAKGYCVMSGIMKGQDVW